MTQTQDDTVAVKLAVVGTCKQIADDVRRVLEETIRDASANGASLRQIAAVADLSPETVRTIIQRERNEK